MLLFFSFLSAEGQEGEVEEAGEGDEEGVTRVEIGGKARQQRHNSGAHDSGGHQA